MTPDFNSFAHDLEYMESFFSSFHSVAFDLRSVMSKVTLNSFSIAYQSPFVGLIIPSIKESFL